MSIEKRKEKITLLLKDKKNTLENIEILEKKSKCLNSEIREVRIGKKIKGIYQIICECDNVYSPTGKTGKKKDPNAQLKDDRPQCKKCGKRVKRKAPVKRDDLKKRKRS